VIVLFLQFIFVVSILFISVYLVRHYVFTITILRKFKRGMPVASDASLTFEPAVSILLPAHNEEKVIGTLLNRMIQLTYPKSKLEVIVIDDASSDGTGQIADEYCKLAGFFKVVHRDKSTGGKGKAAAMNAGFAVSSGDIVLCFDADYCPPIDIVEKLVRPFANPKVGAVMGRPVALNEPQNIITRLVALERISGYRIDQQARDDLGLIPQFGGTIGGYRRCIMEHLGGLDESMLTEDTDLTFEVYEAGYKIRYIEEAECYEEVVDSLKAYWRQRHRWARGHMQVCFKHTPRILKSKKLSFKEKFDGLLLLNIYFLPVVTLLSFVVSAVLIFLGSMQLVSALWFFVAVSMYSFSGNFAPFFEAGIGAYLDGRDRIQWLVPLLLFGFLYNVLICTKAFLDVISAMILRKKQSDWAKTDHLGSGKNYVSNVDLVRRFDE
jgi:cellulose synthase/poly-beta-1,6-N-acetylglucosamine synthase-like glycosyltransferase